MNGKRYQGWAICLIALLCLFSFLLVSLAAPLHKHNSTQTASCLICHASERADVSSIHSDAGKPLVSLADTITLVDKKDFLSRFDSSTRSSRAPPPSDLSL